MAHARTAAKVLLLLSALVAAPASSFEQAFESPCRAPKALTRLDGRLERTADRLNRGEPLRIVALGSSSTAGVGASTPQHTYPARLDAELDQRWPASDVTVENQGVSGETAVDMLARLDRDVIDRLPDLVLWQTGTNDIMRHLDPEEFGRLTREGLDRLRAAGLDVILVEPQYWPKVTDNPAHLRFIALLREIATEYQMPVVRRFDVMQHWIESGQFALASMLSADAFHMKDRSYGCLAEVIAEGIDEAVATRAQPVRLTATQLPVK